MLSPKIFLFFRMTLPFCLASQLEGKVVVLDPEEPQVDVIVDGLGAKGFTERCRFPGSAHGSVHRPGIFNHGRFYVPDEILAFQHLILPTASLAVFRISGLAGISKVDSDPYADFYLIDCATPDLV